MDELFKRVTVVLPKVGDLIEAKVLGRRGSKVFFDLGPFGCGVVYGREFLQARDIIKTLKTFPLPIFMF